VHANQHQRDAVIIGHIDRERGTCNRDGERHSPSGRFSATAQVT
jgi:hypothetical protein